MKLYYSPGACSLAVHIVLRELGAKFDLDRVDLANKKTAAGGDYWQVNPKGYVPALELDDGEVLTEAGVVCQYLADQKPDAGLAPACGTKERYRLMEWLSFTASEVHKQLGALFNPKLTPEMREVQLGGIGRRLDALEKMLAGRAHVMGERFSVGDAYLFTVLNWTNVHKIDVSRWPNIRAFMERVRSRPKVQEALKAEGLVK
jgi:glutathione S-transferase